jgi:epoxyqueuosine reductase
LPNLTSGAIVFFVPNQHGPQDHPKAVSDLIFIEEAIRTCVRESPGNRLPSFNMEPIVDEPLIGFADADDPLFTEYKKVIGEYHLTPREAFTAALIERGAGVVGAAKLRVVSWVLPVSLSTRLSLRRETKVPSLRWNHTRFQGQDFSNDMSRHLVALIEKRGFHAVAPELEKNFKLTRNADGPASNWSQRHVAYAAGLGTFSLNDGFITPKGIAIRLGSIVTDLDLPVSPRPYEGIYSNCLFYRNGSCRRCIERCPAGAVTEKGHDKNKCREYVFTTTKTLLQEMGKFEGFIGYYPACGMCQTKVPCEAGIPPDIRR